MAPTGGSQSRLPYKEEASYVSSVVHLAMASTGLSYRRDIHFALADEQMPRATLVVDLFVRASVEEQGGAGMVVSSNGLGGHEDRAGADQECE